MQAALAPRPVYGQQDIGDKHTSTRLLQATCCFIEASFAFFDVDVSSVGGFIELWKGPVPFIFYWMA